MKIISVAVLAAIAALAVITLIPDPAAAAGVRDLTEGEYERMLGQALAIDVDAKPHWRLGNLVMQRRARWLLARTELVFLD